MSNDNDERLQQKFKKNKLVQFYENGKSRAAIVREYDLTASALDRWIKSSQEHRLLQGEGQSLIRKK